MRSYSDDNGIYSVDMMFMYVNGGGHSKSNVNVNDLSSQLDYKCWGDCRGKQYSPNEVIADVSQYAHEYGRVATSDLRYPIIMFNGFVVDGMHRLAKSKIAGLEHIPAYVFSSELMAKFRIADADDWDTADGVHYDHLVALFQLRF